MLAQEWRSGCFPMRARAMAKGVHSKADAVYAELKESILSGALEPGCLIDKADLCERLGVSRCPVSAAVSKLVYDHLVDVAPQHGSFVTRISVDDVRERLFIRAALEGEIAAVAAHRLDRRSKDALTFNLKQTAAAVDADDKAVRHPPKSTLFPSLPIFRSPSCASEVLD